MKDPVQLVYDLKVIGHDTLLGMRCRKHTYADGLPHWTVDSVADKHVIVNFHQCPLSQADLVEEISQLYMDGAVKVTLVQWEVEIELIIGDVTFVRQAHPKVRSMALV